jgi:xanthosine utilization system XapX-like protein
MRQQVDSFSAPATRLVRYPLVLVLATVLAAHGVLLWAPGALAPSIAALVLAGLLPGILLVVLLVGRSDAPPHPAETFLYGVGVGYGVIVVGMLLLSYLPGGIACLHAAAVVAQATRPTAW